jgi:hypothetical protein
MTTKQRSFIKSLILFYDEREWDWSMAVEFLMWRYKR